MNKKYEFSDKEYFKMYFPRYLIVYLGLNLFFGITLFLNGTLNIVSASVVIIIFTMLMWFLYTKEIGIKSESSLSICCDMVKLEIVKFNGTSSDLITIRRDVDIYIINNLTGYKLHKNYIELHGTGEKKEIRRRNSNTFQKEKTITVVKVPMFFEEKDDFLNKIKQIAGSN